MLNEIVINIILKDKIMSEMAIFGSITALVTPFKNGVVDRKVFQDFVKWQLDQGTNGFVPCGTTGEAPTLVNEEHELLTKLTCEVVKGKAPVIVGSGSNSTKSAIELTNKVHKAGADASLQVVPYYNKPSQEGIYQHFKNIHDNTDIPIILYNVPSRTIVDMSVETLIRLAKLPRIIGIKDATSDLSRPQIIKEECGEDFIQLSGNDNTAFAFLEKGGIGCISVLSNILPKLCSKMHKSFSDGDVETAKQLSEKLNPLAVALFDEPSPSPTKYVLSLMGKIQNELRLPLVNATSEMEEKLKDLLSEINV